MRIKVFREAIAAGPDINITWPAGWEGEVTADLGEALIRGNYAELVEAMAEPMVMAAESKPFRRGRAKKVG